VLVTMMTFFLCLLGLALGIGKGCEGLGPNPVGDQNKLVGGGI